MARVRPTVSVQRHMNGVLIVLTRVDRVQHGLLVMLGPKEDPGAGGSGVGYDSLAEGLYWCRVEEIIEWLNSRPLDQFTPTLPPDFSIGTRRAEQLLQQHLGVGLRTFLERRRLIAARERIIADQGTLKEIAYVLGFRHASHFTAWFRRHTGLSPSAYRQGGAEAA